MTSMRGALSALFAAPLAALLAGACDSTHYEVHVEPQGRGFERSLSAWNVSGTEPDGSPERGPHRIAPEEARRLAALYGKEGFEPGATLAARFERATPDDLGGAGRYLRLGTPLGDLVHYQERVGGSDDLVLRFERVQAAALRAAELLAAWLEQELGASPRWPTLEPVLRTELPRDLANLCLAFQLDQGFRRPIVTPGAGPGSAHVEATAVRLAMYCVEHGYFELDDLPVLLRAAATGQDDGEDAPLDPLRRLVAGRLGVEPGAAEPEELAFLASVRSARSSWERFRTSPRYAALIAAWPTPVAGGEKEDRLLADLLGSELAWRSDRLALSLTTRGAPHWTNGYWDGPASRVRWELEVPGPHGQPVLCFATWAEPDEAAQEARFGRVALRGRALLDYAVWYAALTPQERAHWDAGLEGLDPSRAFGPQLEALTPPALEGALRDPRALIAAGLEG